ncbi:MAG TPA: hypothetical protein VGR28_15525 [Candidatus Thermoplasmatota archaeon]|nr:hypothetical protein [Candidatus Thermoplasmatota archaeon]
MPSPRLAAFAAELEAPLAAQKARAEALILRVPGEGQQPLRADAEARALLALADRLGPLVQGWVGALEELAALERARGPDEDARGAARRFLRLTEEFLAAWEGLLRIQPAKPAMQRLLGLVHVGCYELFSSGPADLARSCRAIAAGEAEARLAFEPEAPSLVLATQELRRLAPRN